MTTSSRLVLASALLWAVCGCGESTSNSERQNRDTGTIRDNTTLSDGVNQREGKPGEATGPTRPVVRDVAIRNGYAYALVPDAVVVLSLADPAKPEVVSRQVVAATPVRLAVDGVHAYVACEQGGLQIVAVGRPRQPELIGAYAPEKGAVSCVAVHNGVAVVGVPGSGVAVVDVSDPAQPSEQKMVPLEGRVDNLAIFEDRAYVLGKDLAIVDLAKPTQAALVGTYQVKETLRDVAGFGAYTVLLADEYLHVLNLRTPERPLRTAEIAMSAVLEALGGEAAEPVEAKPDQPAETTAKAAAEGAKADAPAGGANSAAMINAVDVAPATAATEPAKTEAKTTAAEAKVEPAKDGEAAKETAAPAEPPAASAAPVVRLLVDGERVIFNLGRRVYVLDAAKLKPVLAIDLEEPASCLAVAGELLLVGRASGKLVLYQRGEAGYQSVAVADLAAQQKTEPPAGATAEKGNSKATEAAMQNAPEPSPAKPKDAPPAT